MCVLCDWKTFSRYIIFAKNLTDLGILSQSVLVVTSSNSPSGMIYKAPYTAMTIAEYFKDQGKNVMVVLDDLTIHAKYYRELSLTAKRFPGRDAYPGDIFYLHARLMERAGNFQNGFITCLPIAQTVEGDISGYIQTNLMSMTDGHIYFDQDMFEKGERPSINPFLSVTRVGRQTQSSLLKSVGREITSFLVTYNNLKELQQFGGDVTHDVGKKLQIGKQLTILFEQDSQLIIPSSVSAIFFSLCLAGSYIEYDISEVRFKMHEYALQYYQDQQQKAWFDSMVNEYKSYENVVAAVDQLQTTAW